MRVRSDLALHLCEGGPNHLSLLGVYRDTSVLRTVDATSARVGCVRAQLTVRCWFSWTLVLRSLRR